MSASSLISHRHARLRRRTLRRRARRVALVSVRWALLLASLGAAVVLGVLTQLAETGAPSSLARGLGVAVYGAAWCLGLSLLRPTARPAAVGLAAFAACALVEASQLFHPHALEVARATLPGRLLLGSTFLWSDLAYAAAGVAVGALWLRLLPFRRSGAAPAPHDDFVRPMGVRP